MKKILLFYTFDHSGHHKACLALERAFSASCSDVETRTAHAIDTVHPALSRFFDESYFLLMRRLPSVWGYLYDRDTVTRGATALRPWMFRMATPGLHRLIEAYKPDAVVCTQALACILAADYKRRFSPDLPVFGVLTDFHAHAYWAAANADEYVVPSETAAEGLLRAGIPAGRIRKMGMPVDPDFGRTVLTGQPGGVPHVLVMGGSRGFISEGLLEELDRSRSEFTMTVIVGRNRWLYEKLVKRAHAFLRPTTVLAYVDNVGDHMRKADVVVTKPGGLSVWEAMACGKPLVLVGALPGQESRNVSALAGEHDVFFADSAQDAVSRVGEILSKNARVVEGPDAWRGSASLSIARRVREMV